MLEQAAQWVNDITLYHSEQPDGTCGASERPTACKLPLPGYSAPIVLTHGKIISSDILDNEEVVNPLWI